MKVLSLILCTVFSSYALADTGQQFADIGDFQLQSGQWIKNARVGYRAAGQLNPDRSNIVVSPSWHIGTAADLFIYDYIGSGKPLDTDRYYVIAIDAFANGVSSSPSNSDSQPDHHFPDITITDLVRAQHKLLTGVLGISKVKALVGLSMGGMQALEWLELYPGFMEQVVSVEGTPVMTSYDLIQWHTHVTAIELLKKHGASEQEIFSLVMPINLLTLWTPDYLVNTVKAEDLDTYLSDYIAGNAHLNSDDYQAQTRALMKQDSLDADFLASPGMTDLVAEKLLMIGFDTDHMVNPGPSKALAERTGARYIEVSTACGHMGTDCERERLSQLIHLFLDE